MCSFATTFRRMLTNTIATNTTFRVALRIPKASMKALNLSPRVNMATPSRLGFPSPRPTPALNAPPPAPNKLDICETLDQKQFHIIDFHPLTRLSDIQRWYNAIHSRGCTCGVYTPPWDSYNKNSHMGNMWDINVLTKAIMDKKEIMYAAIHTLLWSKGFFKDDCEDFGHLVSQSRGDGYFALYQIVRMVHLVLGQATTQPSQPAQQGAVIFGACLQLHGVFSVGVLLWPYIFDE
jgi:hypothetical protein